MAAPDIRQTLIQSDTRVVVECAAAYTPCERVLDAALYIEGERLAWVGPRAALPARAAGAPRLEARRLVAAPGFIDLQVNGAGGIDVMRAGPEDLAALARLLPRFGCTAFLPTVVTAAHDRQCTVLSVIGALADRPGNGARILGAHLEGPFLSPEFAGAHDRRFIRPFLLREWEEMQRAAGGHIVLVTLAPEIPENLAAIAQLVGAGVRVSLGHTNATYDDIVMAVQAGATLVTHTFNAMRGLHHREPGAAGAALDLAALFACLIPDGYHLHPAAMRALVRAKGPGRVIAVTDAVAVAGLPAQDYEWEGRRVRFDGSVPRLEDGTIAGSALTTDRALRILVEQVGVSVPEALQMLSSNPARALGRSDLGRLAAGFLADIVLLDEQLHVRMTLVGGRIVFEGAYGPHRSM